MIQTCEKHHWNILMICIIGKYVLRYQPYSENKQVAIVYLFVFVFFK